LLFVGDGDVKVDDVGVNEAVEEAGFVEDALAGEGAAIGSAGALVEREELDGDEADLDRAVDLASEPNGRKRSASELTNELKRAEAALGFWLFEEGSECGREGHTGKTRRILWRR